jgi:hypothetical protein
VYSKIVQHIVSLGRRINLTFHPVRLTCDFETATMNAFSSIFPSIQINACFFHYSQALWRQLQTLGLSRYLLRKVEGDNSISDDERQKAANCFYAAIGLALIPPLLVADTWVQAMDEFTPEHRLATKFNDYLVNTYIDSSSCHFSIKIWNVHDAIVQNLPRTNNSVEGYNSRVGKVFPTHPHIYRFIELLRFEHVFQQHKAEETFVHVRQRRKITDKIDAELALLVEQHAKGEITDLQLAISCGKAVKIKLVKK